MKKFTYWKTTDPSSRQADVTLAAIADAIRGGRSRETVEMIRKIIESHGGDWEAAKAETDPIKRGMSGFCISGTWPNGIRKKSAADQVNRSGWVMLDIDHVGGGVAELRDQIAQDKHVALACISPSGDGVKVAVAVSTEDPWEDCYHTAKTHIEETHGVETDMSCKDVSRFCFLPFDPDVKHHEDAEPLPTVFAPKPEPAPEPIPPQEGRPRESSASDGWITRPGDDFSSRCTLDQITEILTGAGWTFSHESDGNYHFIRPGKTAGISGNWSPSRRVFYNHSSNSGLPAKINGDGFSGFELFAIYRHGGDFKKAAADLHEQGYGEKEQEPEEPAISELLRTAPDNPALIEAGRKAQIIIPCGEAPGSPPVQVRDTAEAIGRQFSKGTPVIFNRGGTPAEVTTSGKIEQLDAESCVTRFERRCFFIRFVKRKDDYLPSPSKISVSDMRSIVKAGEFRDSLPPITIVTRSPVIAENGSGTLKILSKRYNPEAGGVVVKSPTDVPTIEPKQAAAELIRLLDDFNFATAGDKARAFASMVTPGLRFGRLLTCPIPIEIAEADKSQAGKGFLHKMVRAIYGETVPLISKKNGGVGSTDELIGDAIYRGHPFIPLDNWRGKIDSPFFESFTTAESDGVVVRIPYKSPAVVDVRQIVVQMTSNAASMTTDLANRSSITRIRKQPDGYRFRSYDGKDVLAFISEEKTYYLGCVFSLILEWDRQGRPLAESPYHHSMRRWAGTLEWFTQFAGLGSLLVGHSEAKQRLSSPILTWLRKVAGEIKESDRLGDAFLTSELIEVGLEHGFEMPWEGFVKADDYSRRLGVLLGNLYRSAKSETLTLEDFIMVRSIEEHKREDNYGFTELKVYTFHLNNSLDS